MIEELEKQNKENKKKLLLHVCCGFCSSWVVVFLSKYYEVTLYFNNNNIYPEKEYNLRLNSLKKYLDDAQLSVEVITTNYDDSYQMDYFDLKDEREKGSRCHRCIKTRMNEAYNYSEENHYDYFTTVMSISREKDSLMINKIGEELEKKHTVKFLFADFKKNKGLDHTIERAKSFGVYTQNYCGCAYSFRKPDNCTLDYLPNTNIFLFQRKDMFRVNTDTNLLGNFMDDFNGLDVLDVGCNNGALMLYANKNRANLIVGVDVLAEAIDLAEVNCVFNKLNNYQLFNCNIKDFTYHQKFDAIVSNPPYFNNSNISDNNLVATARHLISLDLDGYLKALGDLIKDSGTIYLVYRYDLYNQLKMAIDKNNLYIKEKQLVYEKRKERYQSILLKLTKQKQDPIDLVDVIIPFGTDCK